MTHAGEGGAAAFQKEEYDNLRRQVCELKLQQKQTATVNKKAKESLALQQAQHEVEARYREYEYKVEGLQKQVRDITERSSKTRGQYEREKTALSAKLDKMAVRLDTQQQEHRAELDGMRAKFDEERSQLRALLGQAEEEHERRAAEREAYWRAQHSALREQLEARMLEQHEVQRERVVELEESESHWKRAAEELQSARGDVEVEMEALREEYQRSQDQVRLLQTALSSARQEWAEEREHLQRKADEQRRKVNDMEQSVQYQMMQLETEWQNKLQEYRDAKVADMDAIHTKMKAVLARRDNTIKVLREELRAAQVEMSQLQGIMQQRSKELVELQASAASPWRHSTNDNLF